MSDSLRLRRKRLSATRKQAVKRDENPLLAVRLRVEHGGEFVRAIRHLRTAKNGMSAAAALQERRDSHESRNRLSLDHRLFRTLQIRIRRTRQGHEVDKRVGAVGELRTVSGLLS